MDPSSYKEDKSKFIGIWEITECSLNEKLEIIGLEGIKFRLDEMGDITWFNDLVYAIPSNDNLTDIDNILFCCETYEIYDDGPGIAFGAFAGYSIEFKTDSLKPDKIMNLYCTGWYTLKCRRLDEDQSIRQQAPFTLLSAFELGFFCDDSVTSSDDVQYFLHSPILRMNGFDCSMNYQNEKSSTITTEKIVSKVNNPLITINNISNINNNNNNMTEENQIKISIIAPSSTTTASPSLLSSSFPSTSTSKLPLFSSKTLLNSSSSSSLNVSSDNHHQTYNNHHHHQQHKIISSLLSPSRELFHLSSKIASNLSNSFHCLSSTRKSQEFVDQIIHHNNNNNYCNSNNKLNINNETNSKLNHQNSSSLISLNNIKQPTTSSSDSNLQMASNNNKMNNKIYNNNNNKTIQTKLITSPTSTTTTPPTLTPTPTPTATTTPKNIFNFNEFLLDSNRLIKCRPPLSPYRSKSPSFSSSTDTPPTSPLTPISVLQPLSAEMLEPIIQWLYSESLPEKLPEHICEKLITFAESTIPLNKMAEPCRQYVRAIKLKKFVIRIIMDIHNCLERIINLINPEKLSRLPVNLCLIFKEVLRECAVGCAKILQFCNIFSRTSTRKTREQRNELIKYARSRLPDFTAQIRQLLTNIFKVLSNLNEEEKTELVVYLVPEIKSSLSLLTSIINQIKASLETMCKHIKRSNSLQKKHSTKLTTSSTTTSPTTTTTTTPPPTITNNRRLRQLDITSNNSINKMNDHICFYNCGCTNNPNNTNNNTNINNSSSNNSNGSNNTVFNHQNNNSISRNLHLTDSSESLTESTHGSRNNLNSVLYIYELKKMKDIYERVTSALDVIQQKRTAYNEMNTQNKQETIRNNLEHFLTLIPVYIEMIEELSNSSGELLDWTEFKCFFKLFTSQINGVISKLVAHRLALNDAITFICSVVKNTEFTLSLINLGLLKPNKHLQNQCETELDGRNPDDHDEEKYDFDSPKINLTQHLCEPPIAAQSSLSKNALRLFHVENLTDVEFEIISVQTDRTKLLTPDYETKYERYGDVYNIHLYKAHRVIVAARSEWFRKALLSGMKESINRKFIIHDSSPVIFRRFLLYIYGAPIDNTVGVEQICELMSLADRYTVDELKDICENTLKTLIDDTSVIYLLEIADRYNTIKLKNQCIFYISRNLHIVNFDTFQDLSKSLKLEIEEVMQWYGRLPTEPWTDNDKKRHNSLKSPSRSRRSSPSYRKS